MPAEQQRGCEVQPRRGRRRWRRWGRRLEMEEFALAVAMASRWLASRLIKQMLMIKIMIIIMMIIIAK